MLIACGVNARPSRPLPPLFFDFTGYLQVVIEEIDAANVEG